MAVRVTYVAIAVGGACGAFAALVGSPNRPTPAATQAPAASLPMRPIAELPRPAGSARATMTASESRRLVEPSSPNAGAALSSSAAPSASSAGSAVPAAPPLSSAETAPPPASKEALLRTEMRCDQRNAVACILAARAYETGSAAASDPEKAAKYRKIALTLWISQCDHNSPAACAILSAMYRAGHGVPQSERNADALLARTRELCHYNDAPACHELPRTPPR